MTIPSLYTPTQITKINDTYFIVDCWHHRIIYSDRVSRPISEWCLLDGTTLHGPHTLASDGDYYLVDNTDKHSVHVYKKIKGDFKLIQVLEGVGVRPHQVVYFNELNRFLVLSSCTQEIFVLHHSEGSFFVERVFHLDKLQGVYCRSFNFVDDCLVFVGSNGSLVFYRFSGDRLEFSHSIVVDGSIKGRFGLNYFAKIAGRYYLSYTPSGLVVSDTLQGFATADFIHCLEESLGTPYFFSVFDEQVFIPYIALPPELSQVEHDQSSGLYVFDLMPQKATNKRDLKLINTYHHVASPSELSCHIKRTGSITVTNQQAGFEINLWQLGAWQTLASTNTDLSENSLVQSLASCYSGLSQIQVGGCEQGVGLIKSVSQKLSTDDLKTSLLSGLAYSLGRARGQLGASDQNAEKAQAWFHFSAHLALGDLAVPSLVEKRTQPVKQLPVEFKLPDDQWAVAYPEWLENYVFNDALGFWHRPAAKSIDYSDGDEIEGRLLNALHASADVSLFSKDLIQHQKDWPSIYHFSADRVNLLRPLASTLASSKVLELGCGCGAITRYLGELGAEVVALEGSLRRAEIAAARTRDLNKVTIVADHLQDLPLKGAFDVVTLIGVLEYSQIFVDADDPIQAVLERAKSYLKPNGILLVAIENQLGLKYFAGAPEDHGMGVMAGINDLYTDKTAITFGHQELQQRIQQAGFNRVETFLPFPDYKLPMLVVHPNGYTQHHPRWNLGTLLASSVPCDRQKIPTPTYSLERAWPLIARNGLSADLANSHLFVASLSEEPLADEQVLASYFSPSRAGEYSQQLDFVLQDEDQISIRRQSLENTPATLNLNDAPQEPYLPGVLHADLVHGVLQRPGWSLAALRYWCMPWLESLREHLVEPNEQSIALFGADHKEWLPGHFIDAIPRNLMLEAKGKRSFIDLEWEEPQPLPLALVVCRGLMVTLTMVTSIAEPEVRQHAQPNKLIESLMQELGLPIAEKDYVKFMPVIERLSCRAQGRPVPEQLPTTPYRFNPLTVRGESTIANKATGITLYWATAKQSIHEDRTVKDTWLLSGEKTPISLALPVLDENYTALRLDLTNCPAHLVVSKLLIKNKAGETLWNWDLSPQALTNLVQLIFTPLDDEQAIFISTGNDPQLVLNLPESLYPQLAGASLELDIKGFYLH